MRRYTFLLLAFFLTSSALASGIAPSVMANVNSTPDLRSNRNNSVPDIRGNANRPASTTNNTIPDTSAQPKTDSATTTDIRRTSPRNTSEVGGIVEPAVSGPRTTESQLNTNNSNGARNAPATKTTKTTANSMSCKTYEGKVYDQGEAGYSDCMRNIRTDRQGTRTVP